MASAAARSTRPLAPFTPVVVRCSCRCSRTIKSLQPREKSLRQAPEAVHHPASTVVSSSLASVHHPAPAVASFTHTSPFTVFYGWGLM
ncbi:myosin class II heavy chain [Sesbania bispinosa]|nr:myosin class II heavy chain [Sesbania bispinosa]